MAGAAPRPEPGRLGRGRRDPFTPRKRRFWPVSARLRPCPCRGRAAPGPEQELCLPPRVGMQGVRAARGTPSLLRQGRGGAGRPSAGLQLPPPCSSAVSQRPARPG